MNKAGFSLIAFLVYLTLNILIISCLFCSAIHFIFPALRIISTYKEYVSLHIASDLFVKEVRANNIREWKEVRPDFVVWHNGDVDMGWLCQDNRFERIQGIYKNGVWHKSRKSVVLKNVERVTFTPDYNNGNMIGIELVLIGMHCKEKEIHAYVAMRNESAKK